jgi:hypothetical protein
MSASPALGYEVAIADGQIYRQGVLQVYMYICKINYAVIA